MKEFYDETVYSIDYRKKEYQFTINREGLGLCECITDSNAATVHEDNAMLLKGLCLNDERYLYRYFLIREEFTVDVQLSDEVTELIWTGADLLDEDDPYSGLASSETMERERKIDNLLIPVIRQIFDFSN